MLEDRLGGILLELAIGVLFEEISGEVGRWYVLVCVPVRARVRSLDVAWISSLVDRNGCLYLAAGWRGARC